MKLLIAITVNQPRGYSEQHLESVFAQIFREHEKRLYILAFRLTKSDLYAKDIIQEVFLKLWECRDSIHTIDNMDAWLYRLTENKTIDFLRKAAADNRLKKAIWMKMQQIINEAEVDVSVKEYNQIIQKAIRQLPPQRRLIYQLYKEEGFNYKQIADGLHISRHTVKNHLFTAVRAVRNFLANNVKLFFL